MKENDTGERIGFGLSGENDMAKKLRELKSLLLKAGFTYKPAKGSHSKWTHPKLSKAIILSGKDGSDVKPYLEKQVLQLLAELKDLEAKEK